MLIDNHHLPPLLFLNSIQSKRDLFSENNDMESPLIFQFSDADKCLNKFYQKKICDKYGKATEDFASLSICPFSRHESFSAETLAIHEALNEKKIISTRLKITEKVFSEINLTTSLKELFCYAIEASKENDSSIRPFHVVDIYLIGSSALPLLGKNIFELIALHHFSDHFSDSEIKEWFKNMDHLNHFFTQKVNDLDTRIILSTHRIEEASALSDAFVSFLSKKIPQYARSIIRPYYPKITDEDEMLQCYFLSSSAIKNRKRVNESHSVFALLAINSTPQPIDIICAASVHDEKTDEFHPLLEYPNLTSLNSLSISLSPFLSNSLIESCSFSSQPFGIQVLLDLLFNCATPTTYNQFGWRYFLRKYYRMTHPDDEKKMVQSVMSFRLNNDYSLINRHKFVPNSLEIETLGGFIYLLLANDFTKIESQIPSDPFILSEYLFKACLSLTTYSEMDDNDCKKLWECVDQYYWSPLQLSPNKDSIFSLMKDVILEDKIPFSILSSYMNILGYLYYPTSATTHCHIPVIALKSPFSAFLPIQLTKDCEKINEYFSLHAFPESMKKISCIFIKSTEISFIKFPLSPYFNQLNINSTISKHIEELIFAHSSPLKLIGLQLYLSTLPNSEYIFFKALYHLPAIFIYLETWEQKKAIIHAFQNISENKYEETLPLIGNFYQFNFKESSPEQWLSLLLEVNIELSIKIAYSFFKEHRSYFLKKKQTQLSWKLFHLLLNQQLMNKLQSVDAFDLFYVLMKKLPLPPESQFINAFISLIKRFEIKNPTLQVHTHAKMIKAFQLFFDVTKKEIAFSNHQVEFSKLLNSYLTILYSNPIFQQDADYFLLESCRRGYLTRAHRTSLWNLRIEFLITQKRTTEGVVFYQLIIENKWIQPSQLIFKNHTINGKILIEALLKNNQCHLSLSLLSHYFDKSSSKENVHSILTFLMDYLNTHQDKILDENSQKAIEILFLACPAENLIQFEPALYDYFQTFLYTLKDNENLRISEKTSHYLFFDRIFTHKIIGIFVKNAPLKWLKLFLEYLKITENFSYKERAPQLWTIFELILKYSKSKYKQERTLLYERLANLLNNCSKPSKEITRWMQKTCPDIFSHLFDHDEFETSKALLKYIMEAGLFISNFEAYIWKICINDPLKDQRTIDFFLFSSPEKLQSIIPVDEYSFLYPFFNYLLNSAPQHAALPCWMNWTLDRQEFFDSNQFYTLYLKYIESLLNQSLYAKAFIFSSQLVFQDDNQKKQIDLCAWNIFDKLIPISSKSELSEILSFKNLLKEKKISISIGTLLLEKYYKDKSFSEQDLNLIFDILRSMRTQDLSLWKPFWIQLDQAPLNEKTHKIISESWEIQKFFAKAPNHHSEFIEYWKYLSRSLKKIAHPDVVSLLDELQFFWNSKFHSNTLSTLKQILLTIVSGAIDQIDLIHFDPNQLKSILEKQSLYSTLLFKSSKNKLKESEHWNTVIEKTLFSHLTTSSNPIVIQECCLMLQSKLKQFSEKHPFDSQFLQWIESEVQSIGSCFQGKFMIEEHPHEAILSFCTSIGLHSCVPVQTLLNCISYLNNFFSLQKCFFSSILNRGKINEIQKFKHLFFKLISKDLESKNCTHYHNYIEWINTLKNHCHFSSADKEIEAQIAYQLFNSIEANAFTDLQKLVERANRFYQYSPNFISNLSLFKKGITCILRDLEALKKISREDREKKFPYIMERILGISFLIPYTQKNENAFLNNYDQKIFKDVYALFKDDFEIFEKYFFGYVQKWLCHVQDHPEHTKKAIQIVEAHAFFFPPVFKIELDSFLPENPKAKHWKNYQQLLDAAIQQDLFKDFPNKLIVLQLFDDQQHWSKFKNLQLKELESIITTFCSYGESQPYAICRAAHLLKAFLYLSMRDKAKWSKSLHSNFQTVLTALECHCPIKGKFGRTGLFVSTVNTVFDYLEQQKNTELNSHFAELFYPYSFKLVNELYNDSENVENLIKALTVHLRIISKEILQKQIPNIRQYVERIEQTIPMIKKSIIFGDFNCKNSKQVANGSLINLIQLFMNIILDPVQDVDKKNYKFSISDGWNHNQKVLLTKWYFSLFTFDNADDFLLESKPICEKLINTMFISWVSILGKNADCLFWFEDAYGILLKELMLTNIEKETISSKKVALKSLHLIFHTPPDRRLSEFHLLLEIMNFDEESMLLENPHELIINLEIVLVVFFQWQMFFGHTSPFLDFPIHQQELFEKFLLKIKNIFSQTLFSSIEIKNFLKKITTFSFECQWLKLDRKAGLDFVTWFYSHLALTKEEIYEAPFSLLHLAYSVHSLSNINSFLESEFPLPEGLFIENLANYVVSTRIFFNSWCLIRIISSLNLAQAIKLHLYLKWLKELDYYIVDKETQNRIYKHFEEVLDHIKKTTGLEISLSDCKAQKNEKTKVSQQENFNHDFFKSNAILNALLQ